MCLAEFVAGATGAAYLADVLTYGAESSLVNKSTTGTNGMGEAGNGSSREENE